MKQDTFKVYGYRWIVLVAFMVIVVVNQLLWITFAPITGEAAKFYNVSDLSIGLLSMSFMIVYILVSIPASWVIDTYGLRVGVGIGAVLTAVFGLLRGLWASNYTLVLVAQIGVAIGQPFILNAVTSVAARWFPLRERATASGLGSLAMYLGIFLGLALTPILAIHYQIGGMLLAYGIASVVAALVFLVFARERPATPPCPPGLEVRSLVLDGFKQMLRQKQFLLLLVIFFIGLGAFNAVTTWIENIVRPNGFSSTQAGFIGGVMIVGGILGALVMPIPLRPPSQAHALHHHRAGRRHAGPGRHRLCRQLRAPARCSLYHGLLPAQRRPDRLPVRRRDHLPDTGRHLQRPAHPDGADLRHPVHLWDGQLQIPGQRFHDAFFGGSDYFDGREPGAQFLPQGTAVPADGRRKNRSGLLI